MKKFLAVVLVGGLLAVVAGYFGMQWRVQKVADDVLSSLFFVDASYQDVGIDLNGNINVNNLEIFVPATQTNISIAGIRFSTGSLLNTVLLEKRFNDGKLPENLSLTINSFSAPLDRSMMSSLDAFYEPDVASQIQALGCGRTVAFGPEALYDMGLGYLTFDLTMGYQYNPGSDELTSTTDLYIDGVSNLRMDQTYIGFGSVMSDYRNVLTGFNPESLTPVSLSVDLVDLGFNALRNDYCAEQAGLSVAEWQDLHLGMVAEAMDQVGLSSDVDLLKLYSDLTAQRVRASLSLRPLPGFNMADLAFYDTAQLLNVLDLVLVVNNEEVAVSELSWTDGGLENLDLAELRRAFRVGTEDEVSTTAESSEPASSPRRILTEVPVSSLEQHVNRNILIERRDGQTFSGELIQVNGNRVVIRTRFSSGYTDLPLNRSEFSTAKLYPED
ncbi:hypothetical protein [Reinekea blandensis]|uniref:Uncharacterized protein n=1 Tax=Reinekea blandensis MED297 TaxID=314283 RepID=A4BJS4_9GAMM|nr:hypothetical protein [Reinekea blandensis]EAR07649.1 hypothetical protein MED297_17607 [Reinekea sp. MED297] [Reinekea blandensis MED297]